MNQAPPAEELPLLPNGSTCSDCLHWDRFCSDIIASLTGQERRCDFEPSRFRPKVPITAKVQDTENNAC